VTVFRVAQLLRASTVMISGSSTKRIAVVTGSNKGIGYSIAVQLATSGLFTSVILGCRDPALGQTAVSRIRALLTNSSTRVSCLPLVLGEASSHSDFRTRIEEEHGKLDVLVNNAATAFKGSDPTPFRGQTKPTLDVNFRGTLDLTEELLPLIRAGRDARIVNVASMAGRLGQISNPALREQFSSEGLTLEELRGLVDEFERCVEDGSYGEKGWGKSNYGFSKLALIAATKVLAREEALVRVNCCCPGYCDTDMTSHKGPRSAEDGAKNAVVLATMENCPTGEFYQNMKPSEW